MNRHGRNERHERKRRNVFGFNKKILLSVAGVAFVAVK
jgi:hypothetical protein